MDLKLENIFNEIKCHKQLKKIFRDQYDMKLIDVLIIDYLYRTHKNEITMKEINDYFGQIAKQSEINLCIKFLCNLKLISKYRLKQDERKVMITISDKQFEKMEHLLLKIKNHLKDKGSY